ncbi:dimethyladenosine transferase [Syntrophus gentianae]|uniref:Ribosomal RNA small subunit methyltransferase A n=1 Tax=Syntrophus gentianae TaxID=43775 RepID=A0A1H7XLF1_9BACT|nr:16S rRNA (adenine(1518)-N(6)/adenine(1519)-N(6))-dimethyltransferase RsmA [Syntrophus gentianae]SEM34048.1 dimethyladenosine transferase [Syntrophus gentianae]
MRSVRQILRDFDIRPEKRLGQSFLVDLSVMEKIVDIADIRREETVVEIGSGLGIMTAMIADRAGQVTAVEVDRKLIPILRERLEGHGNVELIQKDILEYDFLPKKGESPDQKVKIVGNIPYSISSPILFHILENRKKISAAVLMMQKEVADRLCAVPGTKAYGIPSVLFGLHTRISRELTVAPECFYPKPQVTSSVVKISIFEEPPFPVLDQSLFTLLVKTAFAKRRKTLFNNLKSRDWQGHDYKNLQHLLEKLGIGEMRRAEELSIQQFAELSNALSEI